MGGTSTSEAGLTTSADGAFALIAGYPLTTGTAAVKTVAGKRVVGRISAAGAIDTSTLLDNAFAAESVRAACSIDGTSFWVSGNHDVPDGGANLGGVHYVTLGSTGARTQVYAELNNLRHCGIFGSQLYATTAQFTGNTNALRLFAVGAGTPKTGGQAATQLPGFQNDGNPQGFVMLDVGATGSPNRLYVADAAAVGAATSGGVSSSTISTLTVLGTHYPPASLASGHAVAAAEGTAPSAPPPRELQEASAPSGMALHGEWQSLAPQLISARLSRAGKSQSCGVC